MEKPQTILKSQFMSDKWDEITAGRNYQQRDIPTLELLCEWYAVIERCKQDLTTKDELPRVCFVNDYGDHKAMPQLAVMKHASAEIRALNKQLGINDEVAQVTPKAQITVLETIQSRRREKQTSQTTPTGRKKAI